MDSPILVQIVGAPAACAEGVQDTWRKVADWVSGQLAARFGEAVRVEYFDLFDSACPPMPPSVQLPVVYISGELFSSGGKINSPAIRKPVETLVYPNDRLG